MINKERIIFAIIIILILAIAFPIIRVGITTSHVYIEWDNYCERVHGDEWSYEKDKHFGNYCYKPNYTTLKLDKIYFTFEEFEKECPLPKMWNLKYKGGWLHECE